MNEPTPGNPGHGLWLDFSPGRPDALHDFCGPNEINGADCPNCSKPLLRILSLSASDLRLNLDCARTPTVHLLYCWTCSIPYGAFSYRVMENGDVQLLQVPTGYPYGFGPDGPYDGYTGHFPLNKVGLRSLTQDEQERQRAAQSDADLTLHLLYLQGHQIGGFPVIANPQEEIICPMCSQRSPLLAVICDNASGTHIGGTPVPAPESFTDNCAVQMVFHFCRHCSVISAYHSCT
jgi:hypothetical protein